MRERIHQLDYLKGIFILLMVTFHLAPIYENYPVLLAAVYTFHMAGFLIISGYLANIENIFTVITKIAVPYISFDPTAICFAVVALTFVVAGCLCCAWPSDKLHLSKYLFAKDQFYIKY